MKARFVFSPLLSVFDFRQKKSVPSLAVLSIALLFVLSSNAYPQEIITGTENEAGEMVLSQEGIDIANEELRKLRRTSDSCVLGFASSGGVSIGTDLTTYAAFMGGAFGTTNFNSTSGRRQHILPYAGVVKNLYIRTTTAQPAGGSLVFTVRKNGTDTAVTLTIAAGGSAGTFTDLTNSVSFDAGDLIDLKAVNNDGVSVSATVNQWSIEYQREN